jgi:hypothetical protein
MCWKNAFPQRSSLLFGLDQLAYECNERLLFGTIAARKEISDLQLRGLSAGGKVGPVEHEHTTAILT